MRTIFSLSKQKNRTAILYQNYGSDLEEGMGFEPTDAVNITAFPMLRLQPLGHPSAFRLTSIPQELPFVKRIIEEFDKL